MVQKLSAGFVTGQRGAVYVRSYEAGRRLHENLQKAGFHVPFYKRSQMISPRFSMHGLKVPGVGSLLLVLWGLAWTYLVLPALSILIARTV